MTMRLLIFDDIPFFGGGQAFLVDLVARLSPTFEPTVVVEQSNAELRRRLGSIAAAVQPLRLHPFRRPTGGRQSLAEVTGLLDAAARLAAVVQTVKPDLIVVNSHLGVLTALPVARLLRRPLLWIVHLSKLGDDALAGDPVVRWLIGAVDAGVAVSGALREDLVRAVPRAADRWAYIPNGIDVDAFADLPAPVEDRLVRFVCVGRLSEVKGQAVLLQALARLDETDPATAARLRIELVGTGEAEAELRTMAARLNLADRVEFAGYQADIRPALARADALVLPSLLETYPLALLEAMAAARPVVATRTSAVPQIAGDRPWARIVPPGDVSALASALAEVAALESAERRRLGALARIEAERDHRIERMVSQYEALFLTLERTHG